MAESVGSWYSLETFVENTLVFRLSAVAYIATPLKPVTGRAVTLYEESPMAKLLVDSVGVVSTSQLIAESVDAASKMS